MHKNIGYHTRLYSDNTQKITGGSFGGAIDQSTVERLVSAHCPTVVIKPSGTAVFVDKQGREVRLYLHVDPESTERGKAALKTYREERHRAELLARGNEEERQQAIDDLTENLTIEQIRALKD